MFEESTLPGCNKIEALVLQDLDRKRLGQELLSLEDVQSLLHDALARLEILDDEQKCQACSRANEKG